MPINSGAGARRMTLDETSAKFFLNARLALDEGRAAAIRAATLDLEAGGVAPLMQALRG